MWTVARKGAVTFRYIAAMHFWRKEYFQTLKHLSAEAIRFPEWSDYASFCTQYEGGFRKQAFEALDKFISEFGRRSFSERRQFVSWLLTRVEGRQGRHMVVPYPLQTRLIEPTLLEWTLVEPNCSEPHLWLGGPEHLREAIKLDPKNELATRKLIVWTMGQVSFAAHELPREYLGDFEADLAAMNEAEQLVPGLQNEQDRSFFSSQIRFDRARIQKYLSDRRT